MNRKLSLITLVVLVSLLGGTMVAAARQKSSLSALPLGQRTSPPGQSSSAAPLASLGSPFTDQGRLPASGSPANGQYDLQFTLFDALTGTNQVSNPVTITNQTVTDGLFTVSLDFGTSAFQGSARFLELAVRPTGG